MMGEYLTLSLRLVTRTTRAVMVARADAPKIGAVWIPLKHFHADDAARIVTTAAHRMGTQDMRIDPDVAREKGLTTPPDPGPSLFGGIS